MNEFKLNIIKPSNDKNSLDMQQFYRQNIDIEELLIWATETGCSDLYIKEFSVPYISRFGKIVKLPCNPTTRDIFMTFYEKYITNEQNASYVLDKMLDTAIEIRIPSDSPLYNKYPTPYFRYRASIGFSSSAEEINTSARIITFRMIRPENPTFDTINYPEVCKKALTVAYNKKTGISIMTGPTGSGKTSTQVACVNTFTQEGQPLDNKVIISLEDPIEYTFNQTDNVKINQKELGKDFKSYANGIKQALREHPNIILVGECRDKEVIEAAIEAARTGHMVSTSFHASDVAGTISRLSYHLNNDINLVYDLICNLNIIMSQRLIPSDTGYVVDTQYMLFEDDITKRILDIIDSGKNVSVEINKLFKDEELLKNGIVKDWDN